MTALDDVISHVIRRGSPTVIKGIFVAIARFIYGWSQRRRQKKSATTVTQVEGHH